MVLTLAEYADSSTEETSKFQQHCSTVMSNMQNIRRQGKLCDVTLKAGESRFSAHRIVLAATIPFFTGMLTHGLSEENMEVIVINEVEEHALECLINFAYTGEVTVDIYTVESVLYGANYFQLDNVKQFCQDFIIKHMNAYNALGVRDFGKRLMCFPLVQRADSFIHKHFVDVAKSDEFLKLDIEQVVEIISHSELNVTSEEDVFHASNSWIMHVPEKRSSHMHELLEKVRLPLLRPRFLSDVVQTDPTCKRCLLCRDLVDRAKDYHLMPDRRGDFPAELVTPRYCSELNGIIYAVGGLSTAGDALNTVEKYSPVANSWEQVASLQSCRSRVGVAVLHGKLYAAGGYDGNERQNTVEMFTPRTNTWSYVTSMNCTRSALGCCTHDDQIYACGGYNGISSLKTCETYNPHTNKWKYIASMDKARSAVAVVSFERAVWVLGGHDSMTIFNSVECYDPASDSWSKAALMLSKRCRHGAAALKDKMFVFGGYDGREFLNTCEVWDRTSQQFTNVIAPMTARRSRVGVAISGKRIYCLGGYDGILNLKSVEVYDSEGGEDGSGEWLEGEDMIVHDGGVGVATIFPEV